jgi:TetR/AcrR family transcriptional regulator, regulator of autoinduction and epiphytic fitness
MAVTATAEPKVAGLTLSLVAPVAEEDGRRLRREQNREAVIEALLALFSAGQYHPSSAEIAAKAGLSPRSLFRYFDDVHDLHRTAVARQIQVALPYLQLSVGCDDQLAGRIEAVVQSRAAVFEHVGPAARALRANAGHNQRLAAVLAGVRGFLRDQLSELFAAELTGRRDVLLPAVDVLCSFESYDLLRRESGLSPAAAKATLVTALTTLLTGDANVS